MSNVAKPVKSKGVKFGGPGQIFEVRATMHLEPMRDGTGRIRTYSQGEYCQDPFGRNLVEMYPEKFVYAPVGVSPKFVEDECDDTLEEVAEAYQADQRKKLLDAQKKLMKKGRAVPALEEDEAVEDEEVLEDEEETLVVEDLDEEEELVEDDLDEEEEEEVKPVVVKKKKKSKKSR